MSKKSKMVTDPLKTYVIEVCDESNQWKFKIPKLILSFKKYVLKLKKILTYKSNRKLYKIHNTFQYTYLKIMKDGLKIVKLISIFFRMQLYEVTVAQNVKFFQRVSESSVTSRNIYIPFRGKQFCILTFFRISHSLVRKQDF